MRSGEIRPRVMVLERKDDDEEPLISREDSWSWRLLKPLGIDRHEFRPNFHVLLRLKELKDAGGFEVADHRAAVWNNGFTEAYDRVSDIVAWLDGADDNVLVPR